MDIEYKKLFRNYIVIAIIIILLLLLSMFGTKYVSKKYEQTIINSKINANIDNIKDNAINKVNDTIYTNLKKELDDLSNALNSNSNFDEYDYSIRLRYYYNKTIIYDRELDRINKIILEKIPKNMQNKYIADHDSFKKQREDNCKKKIYGIDDAHLANMQYYENYSLITLKRCYDVLDEHQIYLNQ